MCIILFFKVRGQLLPNKESGGFFHKILFWLRGECLVCYLLSGCVLELLRMGIDKGVLSFKSNYKHFKSPVFLLSRAPAIRGLFYLFAVFYSIILPGCLATNTHDKHGAADDLNVIRIKDVEIKELLSH